jgi:hypothetical protein
MLLCWQPHCGTSVTLVSVSCKYMFAISQRAQQSTQPRRPDQFDNMFVACVVANALALTLLQFTALLKLCIACCMAVICTHVCIVA